MRTTSPSRTLLSDDDIRVELVHYCAHEEQAEHAHPHHQLSFLLTGEFAELVLGDEHKPLGPHHRFHPAGTGHSVRFGARGAVLLAMELRETSQGAGIPHRWRPSGSAIGEQTRLLLAGVAPASEVTDGLLAAASLWQEETARDPRRAPQWLRRAAEQIADDPTAGIADIAGQAGVHRVHLSRSFQRHYGVSPSQYRLYCKCSLALQHLVERDEPAAMAAHFAGFADQSHWSRASRAIAGVAPGRWRRMLAT